VADRDTIAVTVQILGKDYRVACLSHEREALLASAGLLNAKMREIKNSGKVIGNESVAVMAGLNMAHELLAVSAPREALGNGFRESRFWRSLRCSLRLWKFLEPIRNTLGAKLWCCVHVRWTESLMHQSPLPLEPVGSRGTEADGMRGGRHSILAAQALPAHALRSLYAR